MRWSRLIFRDKIAVNAEYAEMATYFKKRIGENYFKGYIDEHQTQLFCDWDFLPFRIMPIPVCQLNFIDKKTADGVIEVRFKIVNALVLLLVIAGGLIAYEMFAMNAPLVFVLFPPAFFYLFLVFKYNHTFSNLMADLKTIEYHHEHRILNTEH